MSKTTNSSPIGGRFRRPRGKEFAVLGDHLTFGRNDDRRVIDFIVRAFLEQRAGNEPDFLFVREFEQRLSDRATRNWLGHLARMCTIRSLNEDFGEYDQVRVPEAHDEFRVGSEFVQVCRQSLLDVRVQIAIELGDGYTKKTTLRVLIRHDDSSGSNRRRRCIACRLGPPSAVIRPRGLWLFRGSAFPV